MKKTLMITIGICLLLGGGAHVWWWGTAIHQARSMMTSGPAQTEEAFQAQYGHLAKVLSKMDVDLFATAIEGDAASPEALAHRMAKVMHTQVTLGMLGALAGLVCLVIGTRTFRP